MALSNTSEHKYFGTANAKHGLNESANAGSQLCQWSFVRKPCENCVCGSPKWRCCCACSKYDYSSWLHHLEVSCVIICFAVASVSSYSSPSTSLGRVWWGRGMIVAVGPQPFLCWAYAEHTKSVWKIIIRMPWHPK